MSIPADAGGCKDGGISAIDLSIVVTNHNYARFLAAAIDSALAQTHDAVEVVVVDDGSTDGSQEVIAAYGDRLVPVLKENGGQASAMNAGLRVAHGRAVVFLDADDVLYPHAAKAFERAVATPDASKAQGLLDVLDAEGRPTGKRVPARPAQAGDLRARVLAVGPGSHVCPPCSGNAWSRRFLEQVMPLPEGPRDAGGDGYLIDTAPLFGRVVNVGEAIGGYRQHTASLSARRGLSCTSLWQVLQSHRRRSRFLAEVAGRQQERVEADRWERASWRQVALRELLWRLGGPVERPAVSEFVAALRANRPSGPKVLVLCAWAAALRLLPTRGALALGARVIRFKYMP